MKKTLKIVDLFSGAGGMSLGFELSNKFSVIAAIDNWQPAIDTFRYNHPHIDDKYVICASVDDVFDEANEYFKPILDKLMETGVDIIIGGPPCQGMSLAGKRLSEDPRNQLFKSFVKAVDRLKPMAFVMENVPGLLSTDGGEINRAILKAFADIGYNHFEQHKPQVLKAECFGVPQIRRRLFYVGFREDISSDFLNWPPEASHMEFDRTKNKQIPDLFEDQINLTSKPEPVSVKEAISDLPEIASGEGADELDYLKVAPELSDFQLKMRDWSRCPRQGEVQKIFNHEASNHTDKLIGLIEAAEPGKSVDPKYADSKKWDPNAPGFTVKALGAGGGSTNRRAFHYSKTQLRGSTVRENARIQSFPDWYRFIGAKTNQMTQVGNAVPPLLAKAIALSLFEKLKNIDK